MRKYKRHICIFLIIILASPFCFKPKESEAAFFIPVLAKPLVSGIANILVASGLIGVAGYLGHRFISGIMSLRVNDAFNRMTQEQREAVVTQATLSGTTNVNLTLEQLTALGATSILSSLATEAVFSSPVEVPVSENVAVSISSFIHEGNSLLGTLTEVNRLLYVQAAAAATELRVIAKGKQIPIEVLITYNTSGGRFHGRYRDWETDRKSTRLNSSH